MFTIITSPYVHPDLFTITMHVYLTMSDLMCSPPRTVQKDSSSVYPSTYSKGNTNVNITSNVQSKNVNKNLDQ